MPWLSAPTCRRRATTRRATTRRATTRRAITRHATARRAAARRAAAWRAAALHARCPAPAQANADTAAKDLAKLLGAAWKALSDQERKQWEAAAEEDKVRCNPK